MTSSAKYRQVFKRVERDDEFRARLLALKNHDQYAIKSFSGAVLDAHAWAEYKVQRRIIEDVTE